MKDNLTTKDAPKKNWFARHKVWTGAFIVTILLFIIGIALNNEGIAGFIGEAWVIYLIVWALYGREHNW